MIAETIEKPMKIVPGNFGAAREATGSELEALLPLLHAFAGRLAEQSAMVASELRRICGFRDSVRKTEATNALSLFRCTVDQELSKQ